MSAVAGTCPATSGESNGGGELLAFAPDGRVVMVPFVPMEAADALDAAPPFADLLRAFGRAARAP